MKKIKSALISVYYKDGLERIVRKLAEDGVAIYSTGGTLSFIESLGLKGHLGRKPDGLSVDPRRTRQDAPPESFRRHPRPPRQPERLRTGGAVRNTRDRRGDRRPLSVRADRRFGAPEQDVIEKIDIGGISLIRAAAKNFKDVVIVPSVDQYAEFFEIIDAQHSSTTLEQRRRFAAHAFNVSSHYDTAIFNYFNRQEKIDSFKLSLTRGTTLRYGENPHQAATFYGDLDGLFEKLNGKEISYNNLLDIDAAVGLIGEFTEPTFVIMKHNNACGVASRPTVLEAWKDALAGDPVSAFGGVLITNREVDAATADEINKLFFEVILAPSYSEAALETLRSKKNRIILRLKQTERAPQLFRSLLNGVAVQDRDAKVGGVDGEPHYATEKHASAEQTADLIFANKIVKHSKSNAIVLAKNGMLLSSGIGQTSRVDALKQAIAKAKGFGFDLKGARHGLGRLLPVRRLRRDRP